MRLATDGGQSISIGCISYHYQWDTINYSKDKYKKISGKKYQANRIYQVQKINK